MIVWGSVKVPNRCGFWFSVNDEAISKIIRAFCFLTSSIVTNSLKDKSIHVISSGCSTRLLMTLNSDRIFEIRLLDNLMDLGIRVIYSIVKTGGKYVREGRRI